MNQQHTIDWDFFGIERRTRPDHWQVTVNRESKKQQALFYDHLLGSTENALRAAQQWRNQFRDHERAQTAMNLAKRIRTTNRSGKTGVTLLRSNRRGKDGELIIYKYWQAQTPNGTRPFRSKSFSIRKYGAEEAYKLAVAAREQFEQQSTLASNKSGHNSQIINVNVSGKSSINWDLRSIERRSRFGHPHWLVIIHRDGEYVKERFFDYLWGGIECALQQAQQWRDQADEEYRHKAQIKAAKLIRKNNTSGHPGVFLRTTIRRHGNGSVKHYQCWQAQTPNGCKPFQSKSFSVLTYGDEHAYALAVAARQQFEFLLENLTA